MEATSSVSTQAEASTSACSAGGLQKKRKTRKGVLLSPTANSLATVRR